MKINKELLKGSTVVLILNLLKDKQMYGYEMIKAVEEKSKGVFSFKEGTLYPILHSLESDGYVESFWKDSDEGRRRKYYGITKTGSKYLNEKEKEWKTFKDAVDNFIMEARLWG